MNGYLDANRQHFDFGDGVAIELIPDERPHHHHRGGGSGGEEGHGMMLLNNNGWSDFTLELSNFSGRLRVLRPDEIAKAAVHEAGEEATSNATDTEHEQEPFSLALGRASDLVAALALEASSAPSGRSNVRREDSETEPDTPDVSSSDEGNHTIFHNSNCNQSSSTPTCGNTNGESLLQKVTSPHNDSVNNNNNTSPLSKMPATQNDSQAASNVFESSQHPTYHELESDKPIEQRKKGKDMFKHLVKGVIHSPKYGIKRMDSDEDGVHSVLHNLQGGWSNLLYATSIKKQVPSLLRERRLQQRSNASSSLFHEKPSAAPPTVLHELCGDPVVTLPDLQAALTAHPEAVAMKNEQGRLPIHILGDNDALVAQPTGKQTATTFGWALMQAYPEGLTMLDSNGFMPFCQLLDDWFQFTYEMYRKERKGVKVENKSKNVFDHVNLGSGLVPNVVTRVLGSSNGNDSKPSSVTFSQAFRHESTDKLVDIPAHQASNATISDRHVLSGDTRHDLIEFSLKAHPHVELWDEVEWSLSMLSLALDELGGKNGGLHKAKSRALVHHHVKDRHARTAIGTHLVRTMPTLLKTILLLEDDSDGRKRLLKLSVVRRMLLCPESIGPWLTNMLRRNGIASKRAVDYLELVSGTKVEDYLGAYRTPLSGDTKAFCEERALVFTKVEELDGVVASLVTMDRKEVERAAATPVVWSVMNRNLRRPFVVGLVLIDFVLHITLMLAFRNDVSVISIDSSSVGNVPTQVVIFICSHYFLRKICESLSLLSLSLNVFRHFFMNVWTIFDICSIVLTLAAVIWRENKEYEYRNGFNAFVLGLLWLKVLGFLKVVNKEMSTFILALVQILRDLKYFAVVLMAIVFMFGDMMRIAVTTNDDGRFCLSSEDLGGPAADFCSEDVLNSYLRVYALLLGDFELDDWRDTKGMTVLFVIFTLIGVVILLNVLIAIISDSYEKAKIKNTLLFGRARVAFVAQNEALESFLRPGNSFEASLTFLRAPRQSIVNAARFFRYLVLLAIIATAMNAEVYLVTRAWSFFQEGNNVPILTFVTVVCSCLVLTVALWAVLNFAFEGVIRTHTHRHCVKMYAYIDKCSRASVNAIASRLFGLPAVQILDADEFQEEKLEEEWTGRLTYMEKAFERNIKEAREDITNEIMALERRLYEHKFLAESADTLEVSETMARRRASTMGSRSCSK